MQLCKKLEVGMLLLALFYLFSPLVSVSKTCVLFVICLVMAFCKKRIFGF